MTDSRIKDRLDRHGELKGIRAIEEPHWREIAMLMRPDDRDFDAHVQRRRDDTAIFDSTQLYALDDFCAAIFTQLTNPANRWCELTIADQDLLKYQPVAQWLYRHSSKMLATFSETVSPFYTEVMPWLANTGAFGVKVYPSTNGKIGSASTNSAWSTVLAVGKFQTFRAINKTLWVVSY